MVTATYKQGYELLVKELDSDFEASQLLAFITGKQRHQLGFLKDQLMSTLEYEQLIKLAKRRKNGEPLQYIIGVWEFYSLPFYVGEGVLIPRADTETLVDKALDLMRGQRRPKVIDLCAGSGCIGIAIDKNSDAEVTCVELSPKALGYLQRNVELNSSNVRALNEDVLVYEPESVVDIIVSNPPYIPSSDIQALQVEVQKEPPMALDGGADGLDFYRRISEHYFKYIAANGYICFEIGIGQHEDVAKILSDCGYGNVDFSKDLSGVIRVVTAQKI